VIGSPAAADVHVVARSYDTVVARLVERHGPRSIAVLLALQDHLVTQLDLLRQMPARAREIRPTIDRLVRDLTERHRATSIVDIPALCRRDGDVMEFDRDHYARYRELAARISHDVIDLDESTAGRVEPLHAHLFVVDEALRLRVYARPISLADVLVGRVGGTGAERVTHPMLVDGALRVRAAGELILVGQRPVSAVVATLRSGHFRPPPRTAQIVREVCRERLPYASDVITFALGPQR
jgi:hypothetical protein